MCYASGLVELHGRVHAMCPRQPVGVGAASRGRSMRLPQPFCPFVMIHLYVPDPWDVAHLHVNQLCHCLSWSNKAGVTDVQQ